MQLRDILLKILDTSSGNLAEPVDNKWKQLTVEDGEESRRRNPQTDTSDTKDQKNPAPAQQRETKADLSPESPLTLLQYRDKLFDAVRAHGKGRQDDSSNEQGLACEGINQYRSEYQFGSQNEKAVKNLQIDELLRAAESQHHKNEILIAGLIAYFKETQHLGAKVASLIKGQPLEKIKEILSKGLLLPLDPKTQPRLEQRDNNDRKDQKNPNPVSRQVKLDKDVNLKLYPESQAWFDRELARQNVEVTTTVAAAVTAALYSWNLFSHDNKKDKDKDPYPKFEDRARPSIG